MNQSPWQMEESSPKQRNFGNIPGNHFYNGLQYKRVKGKLRVRGESKPHYSTEKSTYSIDQWKDIKQEEKRKANETKIKTNNKQNNVSTIRSHSVSQQKRKA